MTPKNPVHRLGIDAGALFFKAVLLDPAGGPVLRMRMAHQGDAERWADALLEQVTAFGLPVVGGITGSLAERVAPRLGLEVLEPVTALVETVRREHPGARHVIDAGGGSLSLMTLGADGAFEGYERNSLCAAGTGSFLDEQGARLGITWEELRDLVPVERPPSVAARCAVFAKSDLIHRQQEGWGREAVWSGLCRGLAQTIVMTLFRGRRPQGTVVLAGGVADNPQVVSWIARDLDGEVVIASDPALASARGTAHLASRPMVMAGRARAIVGDAQPPLERRPPLVLRRSHHPAFEVEEAWTDAADNEIRVTSWPRDRLRGFLGVDVGSTSTKLALVDEDERVVLDIYRRTAGDPAGAARALLQALSELAAARSLPVEILGVGTTGSGRRLVGALLGADRVVNEITAHVTGALWADPSVETIFEIGGQDAKYIHAKGGRLRNSNMNYVCAAGTGSFVEELARKLGFPLEEIGDAVEGLSPPLTSDRCTVFMEQDARDLLRRGVPRREVMGSILYSVIRNYLSRVVGGRPVSASRIFFQGATARNRGLVAALENLLDVEVVVSPFCHVMGSVGVALLTLRALRGTGASTRFPGLEAARRPVTLRQDTCTLCNNRCTITTAELGEGSDGPSWGYLCGRDPAGKPGDGGREFELVRERERLWRRPSEEERSLPPDAPLLATPRALQAWTWAPFWRAFFAGLGYRLVLSGRTTRELVERGNAWVGADACFPVKLAHGHLRELLDDPRGLRIFLPHMIAAPEHPAVTGTHFCPYSAGLPAMLRAAAELGGADTSRLLSATMDLRWDPERAARRLHQDLGAALEQPREAFLAAWNAAICAAEAFRRDLSAAGQCGLAALRERERPGVVILGRAYNTYDEGANLELPRKLAGLGLTVVPLDLLAPADEGAGEEFRNVFWESGRRILEGARVVAATPGLHAVYLSNFSCGPDSFVQTYAEAIMGEKPMLMLELDEHAADAGYLTRIEAFADVLGASPVREVARFSLARPPADRDALRGRTLWIPPMHEAATPFMAAAMRACGYRAEPLPSEDPESFALGRAHTRGGECLPCPATLGTFLKAVRDSGDDPSRHALFMPSAAGPCRFGQYSTLHRMILDRLGWRDVPIVSWNSSNNYDGTDLRTRRYLWTAIVLGDLLFKMRCHSRPWEREAGSTEEVYRLMRHRIAAALEARGDVRELVREARDRFLALPREPGPRPLVGVVGEIYVRQNAFTNQHLVRCIEAAGGEAWVAPISEWIIYTGFMDSWRLRERRGSMAERFASHLRNRFLAHDEETWTRAAMPLLDQRGEPPLESSLSEGSRWFPLEFEGEAILTVGRAVEFMKAGASLVVNCAPFGCMPGTMTASVFQAVERAWGIPVASMFYDGEGDINGRVAAFVSNRSPGDRAMARLEPA